MLLATLLACRPSLPPPRTEIEHREVFAEPCWSCSMGGWHRREYSWYTNRVLGAGIGGRLP